MAKRTKQTRLGPTTGRKCKAYGDQYAPRTYVRIGPVEGAMCAAILARERGDANTSWIVLIGLDALKNDVRPPYQHYSWYSPKQSPVKCPWPEVVSFVLPNAVAADVEALLVAPWLAEATGKQLTTTTLYRMAIWAAWYRLGCPLRGTAPLTTTTVAPAIPDQAERVQQAVLSAFGIDAPTTE